MKSTVCFLLLLLSHTVFASEYTCDVGGHDNAGTHFWDIGTMKLSPGVPSKSLSLNVSGDHLQCGFLGDGTRDKPSLYCVVLLKFEQARLKFVDGRRARRLLAYKRNTRTGVVMLATLFYTQDGAEDLGYDTSSPSEPNVNYTVQCTLTRR